MPHQDSPTEYFYNSSTGKLYYYPNTTITAAGTTGIDTSGAPKGVFEAVVNQTLVSLKGTQDRPVKGVEFKGVTFKDSAYTYMMPHGGVVAAVFVLC